MSDMKEQSTQPSTIDDDDMKRIAQYCHILSVRSGKSKNQVMMEGLRAFEVILAAYEDIESITKANQEANAQELNGKEIH